MEIGGDNSGGKKKKKRQKQQLNMIPGLNIPPCSGVKG